MLANLGECPRTESDGLQTVGRGFESFHSCHLSISRALGRYQLVESSLGLLITSVQSPILIRTPVIRGVRR